MGLNFDEGVRKIEEGALSEVDSDSDDTQEGISSCILPSL